MLKYKKPILPIVLVKNQHFQSIPVRSGMHGHISSSSYELLSAPWVNKLQYTKIIFTSSRVSNTTPNFQLVNKPSQISPHEILQSGLFNTLFHLLTVKNNEGEGRARLKRARGLINFLPLKRGGAGGGVLNKGFMVININF